MDEIDNVTSNQENVEQSRALWIILSALTVIAIVVVAGIFFLNPFAKVDLNRPQLSSLPTENNMRDFDHVEYVRNADGYPQLVESDPVDEEFSVETESEERPLLEEDSPLEESSNLPETPVDEERLTDENGQYVEPVNEDRKGSSGEKVADIENVPSKAEGNDYVNSDNNVVEVKKEVPIPVARTSQVEAIKKIEPNKVETKKISVTVYWIQVGSYGDLIKAEEVRDFLLLKEISSIIQTKSVDNRTYYRVRIGAFQSKGEANRFLKSIRTMNNFEESYVVQTTMVKEVPVN